MNPPENKGETEQGAGGLEAHRAAPYSQNPTEGLPPLRDPEYRWRLKRLRDRQFGFLNSLTSLIKIVYFFVLMFLVSLFCYLMSTAVMELWRADSPSMIGITDLSLPEAAILIVLLLILVVGCPLYLVHLLGPAIQRYVDNMHLSRYTLAASYLHHTDFLRVVAEEDFTQIIIEQVAEIPSLRWFSPQRPKTIEQQLDFSASYWNSIVQLSYGPGRLDNASLINGSWTYQLSRVNPYLCCVCCCIPYVGIMFVILSAPIFIMTCNHQLTKLARISCIIDYLCEDRFSE
jgi:hypothetical protein